MLPNLADSQHRIKSAKSSIFGKAQCNCPNIIFGKGDPPEVRKGDPCLFSVEGGWLMKGVDGLDRLCYASFKKFEKCGALVFAIWHSRFIA